jgi:hypothetical protein
VSPSIALANALARAPGSVAQSTVVAALAALALANAKPSVSISETRPQSQILRSLRCLSNAVSDDRTDRTVIFPPQKVRWTL